MATKRTWHQKHLEQLTVGQRVADSIASMIGSWGFITFQSTLIVVWISINVYGVLAQWDPYPFVFLNLVLGALASYAGPIIMMAQNRQEERDRTQAEADFQTTLEIKREIDEVKASLQRIENRLIKAAPRSKK